MPTLVHLTAADVVRRPWKNGRGATDELLLVPRDGDFAASRFDWRVARARVDEPGPFSEFTGFERVIVVVSGEGLRLDHGGAAPPEWVAPLSPYRFAGEWSTSAELPSGPVQDVNVLLRRAVVRGEVSIVRAIPCARPLRGNESLVHVLAGRVGVRVGEQPPIALAPGESLFVRGLAQPTVCAFSAAAAGDACVLVVDVTRRGAR